MPINDRSPVRNENKDGNWHEIIKKLSPIGNGIESIYTAYKNTVIRYSLSDVNCRRESRYKNFWQDPLFLEIFMQELQVAGWNYNENNVKIGLSLFTKNKKSAYPI